VYVADPGGPQLRAQGLSVELRVVSRAWDTAHIYDTLDTVRPQNLEKLCPGAGGMTNRKDSRHLDLSQRRIPFPSNPMAGNEMKIDPPI
jgi:hypothetical protein